MNTINEQLVGCTVCEIESSRITNQNKLVHVTPDNYPVIKGHILIISKRHVKDCFGLSVSETSAIYELIIKEKEKLIEGCNIGVNSREVAGQPFLHCHLHLLPRRKGDVKNPRGGVRHDKWRRRLQDV